ncbi:hypothetical protein, partial [Succinivibrio sp.]|uniref:hypothetical protein n=1 Tax=Succinivibrio sp. TaxID=2053619 RepID=UPI00386D624C
DHLNFNRAYASSDKAFKGKFLCQFIAASLYMFLERRIKEYEATDADPDYEAEDSVMTLASGEEI